jgi:hypothetical protein
VRRGSTSVVFAVPYQVDGSLVTSFPFRSPIGFDPKSVRRQIAKQGVKFFGNVCC